MSPKRLTAQAKVGATCENGVVEMTARTVRQHRYPGLTPAATRSDRGAKADA